MWPWSPVPLAISGFSSVWQLRQVSCDSWLPAGWHLVQLRQALQRRVRLGQRRPGEKMSAPAPKASVSDTRMATPPKEHHLKIHR